jgi:hypothetical protein
MEIDVVDGYRPNRWAKFNQPSSLSGISTRKIKKNNTA